MQSSETVILQDSRTKIFLAGSIRQSQMVQKVHHINYVQDKIVLFSLLMHSFSTEASVSILTSK